MGQLAWRSQRTVQHCGNGIRMMAASTMPNQIPHRPLQAYMDETSIAKHVQLWQQTLLFIICTQTESDKAEAGRSTQVGRDRLEAFVMTLLETVCLDFCIELLNQKTKVHKYKSPLVCAMAVLGRGEQGWRDANSYPPILSRKALWLDPQHWDIIQMWAAAAEQGSWVGEAADQELAWLFEDEGYAEALSPSSPSSQETASASQARTIGRIRSRSFQAGVDWMVQRFMVRGQHGPVEVLLDWRTYGLKMHYNTTAPGHVTWMGQDRLLYKQMDFTMGQFRSFVHGVVGAARELMASLLCQPDRQQCA
ncbi:hypothetical protein BDV11DRAFT_214658 [Aspergillus similis]